MRKCCSNNRCAEIDCASCSRRYATRLARRILATSPRRLFVIEVGVSFPSLTGFWNWRTQIRNLIDHRRRVDGWWNPVELHVWLTHDGRVRGVMVLDALTETEFLSALNARWPTTLRPIGPGHLRDSIYAAVQPEVIATSGPHQARYQFRKLAILARRRRSVMTPNIAAPCLVHSLEPMPVLF
jgi:hypothetical protein